MSDRVRFRIAATVTALFLLGLSVAGLAVRHDAHRPPPQTPALIAPATPQLDSAPPDVWEDGD